MKKHVLLINDEGNETEIFSKAINKMGIPCEILRVHSADHAMTLLQQYSPDFIFIENDPAKDDGLKHVSEIKKTKNAKDIPVILYSEEVGHETIQKAMAVGAHSYIRRPQMIGTLVKKLRQIMLNDYYPLAGK